MSTPVCVPVLSPEAFRKLFMLDPGITFFNHGSFGATPKSVFEVYQDWQRRLESNPVKFIQRLLPDAVMAAKERLATFVGTTCDRLIFVPNATYAINVVARSLPLQPGDEVLGTNHEYGAVNNTWRFNCEKHAAHYRQAEIDLPIVDAESVVEAIWSQVTERTRVIMLSHITAPTALILPVKQICDRARAAGITTVIDGAHALGQIDLSLDELGADYYTGNAHKWLCAPKGSAFLYSRLGPDSELEPLVVSHGWASGESLSRLDNNFGWTGTCDPSAYLSVPAAIDFQEEYEWPAVRQNCHELASQMRRSIESMTGLEPVCPDSTEWYSQLFTAFLPDNFDVNNRAVLYERYQIEVPVHRFLDQRPLIRVSVQAYNTQSDADWLLGALDDLMQN